MKITIKDFGNQELINAIVKYLRSNVHYRFVDDYADSLENGSWLEYYNEKIALEQPDWNN